MCSTGRPLRCHAYCPAPRTGFKTRRRPTMGGVSHAEEFAHVARPPDRCPHPAATRLHRGASPGATPNPNRVGRTTPITSSCPASNECYGAAVVDGTSIAPAPPPESRIGAGCATDIDGPGFAESSARFPIFSCKACAATPSVPPTPGGLARGVRASDRRGTPLWDSGLARLAADTNPARFRRSPGLAACSLRRVATPRTEPSALPRPPPARPACAVPGAPGRTHCPGRAGCAARASPRVSQRRSRANQAANPT